MIASDEAYSELWFDEPPVSALQVADRSRVIVFQTLSKRSSMTGYRSGFVAAPPEVIAALKAYRPTVGTAPQEFVQRASVVAWNDERHVEETRERYRAKRDVLLPVLERKGWEVVASDATMYLWVAVPDEDAVDGRAARARRARLAGLVLRPERRGLRPLRARADARGVRAGSRDPGGAVTTEETIAALDRGEVRVAEKIDGEWRVNEEAKAAILDYFRIRKLEPIEVGPYEYLDKIPLKRDYAELGVRVVPPATARYGAFLSPGVVMMPSYVNIGAWVGPNTMVDTWATVGSCAQIGADVHLAGGVGIGGVLEPVQARPVIVEDGAFIGSRCILTEGVLVGERAVLAPNVSLTGSVPVIDVTGPGAGRVPRLRAAVLGRRAGHAAEGVPRRHVPDRLRADHRHAQRADRPEDVAERRAARVRDRRLRAAHGSAPARSASRGRRASRTRRSPPGKCTSTSPSPCVAAATATALEPDAVVSPTPRSQTRAVTSPGASMRATCTFVRFGKRGCVSSSGPIVGSSRGIADARPRADCRRRPA